MVVTLSDDEESCYDSKIDQEGNFMDFTTTVAVDEFEIVNQKPFDGEFPENADLQKAYNKLCNITAKDAMNVDQRLKKYRHS